MKPLIRIAAAVAILAAAGCGTNTTDVSGKVTFQGKPVVYGTVVLIGSDGIPKSGAIQPDGSYRVSGVAVGAAKVAVTSPRPPSGAQVPKKQGRDAEDDDKILPPPPPPAPPEVIKNWVTLPEKYGNPETSNLTATIKAGEPLEIDLK